MATRLSFSSPRDVMFGYRLDGGARRSRERGKPASDDPIASRPSIPAPLPWATVSDWESDGPSAIRFVRTPIGIARVARAALFVVGLGALYGAALALTSGLVDPPAQAVRGGPAPGVLATHPQPEAVAAQAGERVANGIAGVRRPDGPVRGKL